MKSFAAFLVGVALTASSCGGSSPTSPTTTNQPYTQTITGTVTSFGLTYHALTIPRAGNLSLQLTWPDQAIDLDLYLTASGCTQIYGATGCSPLVGSNNSGGAAETIARTVSSGETFTIFVDNLHLTRSTTYTLNLRIQ